MNFEFKILDWSIWFGISFFGDFQGFDWNEFVIFSVFWHFFNSHGEKYKNLGFRFFGVKIEVSLIRVKVGGRLL